MKKNVGKKFRLMALLASLTLLLWGGVIACSNGSDDDGTSVKLKGAFFEEGDDETPWVYCAEQLTEIESGIWEGEITSVNSKGWDKFGVEVNGTWYGAEEGLEGDITDAKLVKDVKPSFWLATDKGGKSKVTLDLNKMTITVVDANPASDNSDDDEAEEFSYTYEASKISKTATSITITVTDVTSTTSDNWWFWADTDGDKGDDIKWDSKTEDGKDVYKLTIDNATKIAYLKEKGIVIKGAKGLNAEVKVTTTEPTATPPTDEDNDDDGNGDEAKEFYYFYKADQIQENAASITITVSKISGTATDWKFWATTSDSDSDEIKYKSGEGATAIYELTITDATKIAYLKEKGIAIKGAKGLSATVTVTTDEGGTPATLPTWVGINGEFKTKGTWVYTKLEETSTKGIWFATISEATTQHPDFQIQAGDPKKIYAGSATEWKKVEMGGDAIPLVETEKANLGTTCWEENSGTTSVNLKVTVDFTVTPPTIKIGTAE